MWDTAVWFCSTREAARARELASHLKFIKTEVKERPN